MRGSLVRKFAIATFIVVLTASPSFAQQPSLSPTPLLTPAKASPSWTIYMAYLTIGIAALTLILTAIGYLVQAPGFRRGERPARPSTPPASS